MTDEDDKKRDDLARRVGDLLLRSNRKIAVAESCTGGWVCQSLTEVPGSSAWFDRGFITYSNEAKHDMLAVDHRILMEYGAVSEQTVKAMCQGVLAHSLADCALAVSGIAGPSGGSDDKPVGTVWFAWLNREGQSHTALKRFEGDRTAVRRQAVMAALQGILALYGNR